MSGFVAIERGLWDHCFFADGEMTEREAWIWMIARAAWKDTRHKVGGEMVQVARGSFIVTLREMQLVFGWRSDKRVRTFLSRLEGESMIGRTVVGSRNAPKTHVTIREYEEYQSSGRTEDAPKTHRGRTKDAVKEQGNNKQEPKGSKARKRANRPDNVSEDVWSDFVGQRKKLFTETALKLFKAEADKAGWSLEDAFAHAAMRGWEGFNADWVEKRDRPKSERPRQSPAEWLAYCEAQAKKWREIGQRGLAEEWDERARQARGSLPVSIPNLKVVS